MQAKGFNEFLKMLSYVVASFGNQFHAWCSKGAPFLGRCTLHELGGGEGTLVVNFSKMTHYSDTYNNPTPHSAQISKVKELISSGGDFCFSFSHSFPNLNKVFRQSNTLFFSQIKTGGVASNESKWADCYVNGAAEQFGLHLEKSLSVWRMAGQEHLDVVFVWCTDNSSLDNDKGEVKDWKKPEVGDFYVLSLPQNLSHTLEDYEGDGLVERDVRNLFEKPLE